MKRKLVSKIIAVMLMMSILPIYPSVFAFAEDGDNSIKDNQQEATEVYNLTVNFYYDSTEGTKAADSYTAELEPEENYEVNVPTLSGYEARVNGTGNVINSVAGIISSDVTVNVVYTAITDNKVSKAKGDISLNSVVDNTSTIVIHYRSTSGGTVSRDKDQFTEGEENPTLYGSTAIPSDRYHFVGWYDKDNNLVTRELTFMPEMPEGGWATAHYTAVFERGPLRITTEVIGGTIDPSEDVVYGSSKTINYVPYAGYILQNVEVDGVKVDTTIYQNSYTFTNIQIPHTIKVTYVNVGLEGSNITRTYNGSEHSALVTLTGIDQGMFKVEYSSDGGVTWSEEAPFLVNAGTLNVMTRAVSRDTTDTKVYATKSVTVQVVPAAVTINVNNEQRPFGIMDPIFSGSVTGLVNPLDLAVITYYRQNAAADIAVGYYPNVLDALYTSNPNYSVTVNKGNFTIYKGDRGNTVVNAIGYTGFYDGQNHGVVAAVFGEHSAYFNLRYSEDGGATWQLDTPVIKNVGEKTVLVKGVSDEYNDTPIATVTLKINPKNVTVTIQNKSKVYGADDPDFTGIVAGLVPSETLNNLSYSRIAGEAVGTYAINGSESNNPNYNVMIIPGQLTITKAAAAANMTANGYSDIYDGASHFASATLTGAMPADYKIMYSEDNGATWSETAPSIMNVGSKEVLVKAVNQSGNYADIDAVAVTLSVVPKEVTVTIDNKFKVYGTADVELTGTVTGLIDSESLNNLSYSREPGENVGTYVISGNEDNNPNYNVTIVPGEFTIIKAAAGADMTANGYSGTYDGLEHFASAVLAGDAAADYKIMYSEDNGATWSETAPSIMNVGSKEVLVKAVNLSENYEDIDAVAVTLAVATRSVTITVSSTGKVAGTADPVLSGTVVGLIDPNDIGEITYTRVAGEAVGTYEITAGYTPNDNYAVTVVNGVFSISAVPVPAAPPVAGPAPTAPVAEIITPEPAPEAEVEDVVEEEPVVKAKAAKADLKQWALVNLLSAIFTVVMIGLLAFSDKKKNEFAQNAYSNKNTRKKFKVGIVAEIVIAIAATITFILTENMNYDMIMVDKWTLLMLVFAVGSVVTYIAVGRRNEENEVETTA